VGGRCSESARDAGKGGGGEGQMGVLNIGVFPNGKENEEIKMVGSRGGETCQDGACWQRKQQSGNCGSLLEKNKKVRMGRGTGHSETPRSPAGPKKTESRYLSGRLHPRINDAYHRGRSRGELKRRELLGNGKPNSRPRTLVGKG